MRALAAMRAPGMTRPHAPKQAIRALTRAVREACKTTATRLPGAAWLADNGRLLIEEAQSVARDTRRAPKLPCAAPGTARVTVFARALAEDSELDLSEDALRSALRAWQDTDPFTYAELCALPLALRAALLALGAPEAWVCARRQNACARAANIALRLPSATRGHEAALYGSADNQRPARAYDITDHAHMLHNAEQRPARAYGKARWADLVRTVAARARAALGGRAFEHALKRDLGLGAEPAAFTERLLSLLREEEHTQALLRLESALAQNGLVPERLAVREHARQTTEARRVGGMVESLRRISHLPWNAWVERHDAATRVLKEYEGFARMDEESRALYARHCAALSARLGIPEREIARGALECAAGHAGCEGDPGYYLMDDGIPALRAHIERAAQPSARTSPARTRRARRAHAQNQYESTAHAQDRRESTARAQNLRARRARADQATSRNRARQARARGLYVCALLALSVLGAWLSAALGAALWALPLSALCASEGARCLMARVARLAPPRVPARLSLSELPRGERALVVFPTLLVSDRQALRMVRRMCVAQAANPSPCLDFMLLADFADAPSARMADDESILYTAREAVRALNASRCVRGHECFQYIHRRRVLHAPDQRYMGRERKRGALETLNMLIAGQPAPDTFAYASIKPESLKGRYRYVITLDADTWLPPGAAMRLLGTLEHPLQKGRACVIAPRMEVAAGETATPFSLLMGGQGGLDPYNAPASDLNQDWFAAGSFTGKGAYDPLCFLDRTAGRMKPGRVLSHDLLEGEMAGTLLAGDTALYDAHPARLSGWLKRLHRWTRGDWQLLPYLADGSLSRFSRFKIYDNLRRSLVAPARLALLLTALFAGAPWLAAFAAFVPDPYVSRPCAWLVRLITLPMFAYTQLDAMVRALWRMTVSGKNLMQWTTAAQAEATRGDTRAAAASLVCAAAAIAAGFFAGGGALALLLGTGMAIFPFACPLLERAQARRELREDERAPLLDMARDTLGYFTHSVTAHTLWLPPDNVQLSPPRGAAMRTSPTNVGLYLLALCAAQTLGLIDGMTMAERISRALDTLEGLPKWNGHLYNWYDLEHGTVLRPAYVSSVDSGNLCASLLTCAQTARRLMPVIGTAYGELPARLDAIAYGMRLWALYDEQAELFAVGFDADENRLSGARYDLLASESRLLSYVAVMTRQVPVRHYFRLSRALVRAGGGRTLLSWSGTAFEYMMPALLMPLPRGTLLESACLYASREQKRCARGRVFGVSESGYASFDPNLNYQYRAFGIPRLALGHTERTVLAPYAAALMLPTLRGASARALRAMRAIGWYGAHGFYEAADYDARRAGGRVPTLVMSHMAHHQGMLLCAIANALAQDALVRDFMALPSAEAYLPLLMERPSGKRVRRLPACCAPRKPAEGQPMTRRALGGFPVDAHILSGGGATLMVTAQGQGFYKQNGVMITRFRDSAGDEGGFQFYLRDAQTGHCIRVTDEAEAVFTEGAAAFHRVWGALRVSLSQCVSPQTGTALHLLDIRNTGGRDLILEAASFAEVSLADQKADESHPAFQNLFIQTRALSGAAMLARRRRREGEPARAVRHALTADVLLSQALLQSDRMAFLGRGGTLREPREMARRMDDARPVLGVPVNPCLSVRARFSLPSGGRARLLFATSFVERDEPAPPLIDIHSAEEHFALAATSHAVMARYLAVPARRQALYGRMAGCLLYGGQPSPPRAMPAAGRDALWAVGVSGDLPILLVKLSHDAQLPLARHALRAHAMLRMQGVWVDLVLLSEAPEDYHNPLQDALSELALSGHQREIAGQPGGVHLLRRALLPPGALAALERAARLTLKGDAPLGEQLRALKRDAPGDRQPPRALGAPLASVPLEGFNGLGGFTKDEPDGYTCLVPQDGAMPAPYANLLAGARFGTVATELGLGMSYLDNSHDGRITRFQNDAVRAPLEETLLLIWPDGRAASPTPRPAGTACRVTHRPGVTVYESSVYGLELTYTCFTHARHACGLRLLRVRGDAAGLRARFGADIRMAGRAAFQSARAGDGYALFSAPGGEDVFVGAVTPGARAAARTSGEYYGLLGLPVPPGLLADETDSNENGTVAILDCPLDLTGGAGEVCFALGGAGGGAGELLAKLREQGAGAALAEARTVWNARLSGLVVYSHDPLFDRMMNTWLPYQTRASRLMARAGFYQAGGAFGFRDQLQDLLVLLHTEPLAARAHILLCAAHQFLEGDVQHWWHPPRRGVRTRVSDDKLFLPYMTARYVDVTGDQKILDEPVPYLDAPPLAKGVREAYQEAVQSALSEPLAAHCVRALTSVPSGARGMPLMGGGDWNDGMNAVEGESVWLAFFYVITLRAFAPLCTPATAKELLTRADDTLRATNAAFAGGWYARAYYADGRALGAWDSSPPRVDLIAQCFSVLANAPHAQARAAVTQAFSRLWDRQNGIARLLDPPFDETEAAGYITGYAPGLRENGGQYTHAAPWLALALMRLGERASASEVLLGIMPYNHARTRADAARYATEPYVMAGDVYTAKGQYGRGGWTWYTGSAAWMYSVVLEGMLGFEKRGARARLTPRLPDDWPGFTLVYRFGKASYHFTAERGARSATLDGTPVKDGWIPLVDDGRTHQAVFPL